ncbi:MAG: hypothetical protein ACI9YB_001466 [Halioglobus sp.]|jgi:hypothetical protein
MCDFIAYVVTEGNADNYLMCSNLLRIRYDEIAADAYSFFIPSLRESLNQAHSYGIFEGIVGNYH